jgi:RNA polymerase sigma-70 factor (ECF subfamily)
MNDFAAQLVELRPMLTRIARQRLHNDAWVEDAVSETLVAAFENPTAFDGRARLRTWVVGILKHKLVDQIRRHTRECQVPQSFVDEDESDAITLVDSASELLVDTPAGWGDPQEQLSRRQFMALLERCLKDLPAQQSRAFMLRNWAEAETDDICNELGVTANNLAVMLHRARGRLRSAMQRQWAPALA